MTDHDLAPYEEPADDASLIEFLDQQHRESINAQDYEHRLCINEHVGCSIAAQAADHADCNPFGMCADCERREASVLSEDMRYEMAAAAGTEAALASARLSGGTDYLDYARDAESAWRQFERKRANELEAGVTHERRRQIRNAAHIHFARAYWLAAEALSRPLLKKAS